MSATNTALDTNQGPFVRTGWATQLLNLTNTFRGAQAGTTLTLSVGTLAYLVNQFKSQFTNFDQGLTDPLASALAASQNSLTTILSSVQSTAQNGILAFYNRGGAPDQNVQNAMTWLINLMNITSDTVSGNTVTLPTPTVTTTNSSYPTNTAIFCTSVKRADGLVQELLFHETIIATVTSDSQTGGTKLGSEVITFVGAKPVTDQLSFLWPGGSGCSVPITCVSPYNQNAVGGTQNWLNNSDFEAWSGTPAIPTGWTLKTGTWGTTVKQNTTTAADGVSSLEFLGDGTSDLAVYQGLTVSGGGSLQMKPLASYAVNMFVQCVTSAPAAGTIRLSLVDGTGTVINDKMGIANSVTLNLVGQTPNVWLPVDAMFRTPRTLPSSISIQIDFTVAPTSSAVILVDQVAMAQPYLLYSGGPVVAAFSTQTKLVTWDYFTFVPTNNYAGVFQTGFERLFGMRAMNLLLPSNISVSTSAPSGSSTISDALA